MAERTRRERPKPAQPKQDMYRIKNPDPLKAYSVRELARAAGCSSGTVGDLRTGRTTVVSKRIAYGIATAIGSTMDDLFEPTGRKSNERA